MKRTVSDVMAEWEQGSLARGEVCDELLKLVLDTPLDEVIDAVPEPWRSRFVSWIDETFNNDVPADEFMHISSGAPPRPSDGKVIAIAREWLSRKHRT